MLFDWLIEKIPVGHLTTWLWWLSCAALALPALIGFAAMRVNDRIGSLQSEESERKEDTAKAEVEILKKELASANDLASRAITVAHTTEEKTRPRAISLAQKQEFISFVMDADKGRVLIISQTHTDEALRFSQSVFDMLVEAGYNCELRRATNPSFPAGMILMVNPSNDTKHAPQIQNGFRKLGFDCPGQPNDTVNPDEVWLVFGDKSSN